MDEGERGQVMREKGAKIIVTGTRGRSVGGSGWVLSRVSHLYIKIILWLESVIKTRLFSPLVHDMNWR